MTNATATIANLTAESQLYSPVEYTDVATFINMVEHTPAVTHVRGGVETVSKEIIDSVKKSLTFDNGNKFIIKEPITLYLQEFDGSPIPTIADGNNRIRAISELYAARKEGQIFLDVPFRYLLLEPTADVLLRLQLDANDTTNPHSVIQIAKHVDALWIRTHKSAVEDGTPDKTAKGIATKLCEDSTGYTAVYIGQLRQIVASPIWLLTAYDKGQVSLDVIKLMNQLAKTSSHSLELIFKGCQTLAPATDSTITKKIFDKFKVQITKSASTGATPASTPSSDSGESGSGSTSTPSVPKPIDRVGVTQGVATTLTAIFSLDTELMTDDSNEVGYKTAKALVKLCAHVLGNSLNKVNRSQELVESLQSLTQIVFSDNDMVDNLNDDELRSISGLCQMVDKNIGSLSAVISGSVDEDDEESEDEFEDEESDIDSYYEDVFEDEESEDE